MLLFEDYYDDNMGFLCYNKHSILTKLFNISKSDDILDLFSFCAKYKKFSPYSNIAAKLQKRDLIYYDTKIRWGGKHLRILREGAKPIFILSKNGEINIVFDYFDTSGPCDFIMFHQDNYDDYYNKCDDNYLSIKEGILKMCDDLDFHHFGDENVNKLAYANIIKNEVDIFMPKEYNTASNEYLHLLISVICKLFLGHYGAFQKEITIHGLSIKNLNIWKNFGDEDVKSFEAEILHFMFCSIYNIKFNDFKLMDALHKLENLSKLNKINIDFLMQTITVLINIFNKFNGVKKEDFRDYMDELF